MRILGSLALLGLLLWAFRVALVSDAARGYADCQQNILTLATEGADVGYQERQALQRETETTCRVALLKAQVAQAVLAPTTVRDRPLPPLPH